MTQSTDSIVSDRLDIIELHHRYAWALDHRDWQLLENCFTPDGGVDYGDLGGELHGAAEIATFCRRALEGLDATQHLIGNTMVQLDGDAATSTCYFQAQHVFAGARDGDTYIVAGTYTDVLTRREGGWRIAHRTLTPSWTQGNAGVFAQAAERSASP
jgi:ketosteroid isomerase-like protein